MAENDTPPAPQPSNAPAKPSAAPAAKKSADVDRAHIPMGEEFDKAKWTMPPWQPVVIALVIVGIALAVVSYFNRAKPPAAGGIDEITAVPIAGDSVMVAVNIHFGNSSEYLIKVHTIKATVQTSKGEFTDE